MNNFHKPGENGEDNSDMAFQRYNSPYSPQQTLVQEGTILILSQLFPFFAFCYAHHFHENFSIRVRHYHRIYCTSVSWRRARFWWDVDAVFTVTTSRAVSILQFWLRYQHFTSILLLCQTGHIYLLPGEFNIAEKQSTASVKMAIKCSEKTHLKVVLPFFPGRSRRLIFWQDLAMESSFPENYHLNL